MIILMAVYTFSCFSIFARTYEEDKKWILIRQNVLMFLIQFTAYLVMYLQVKEKKLMLFYLAQVILLVAVLVLYRIIYPKVSRLIVNNMCMLLSIGFIIITRLTYTKALKQFIFAVLGTAVGLVVPVVIRKLRCLKDWTYIYAGIGVAALGAGGVVGEF